MKRKLGGPIVLMTPGETDADGTLPPSFTLGAGHLTLLQAMRLSSPTKPSMV